MALSPEQISEINRRNAASSCGPKTALGKSHSRFGRLVHGLRAETLTLPNEPLEWVAELRDEWGNYYQPQSPGRRALVDRAIMATVHHKRSSQYVTGTLAKQVRNAELTFNTQQEDVARHYLALLKDGPSTAVRKLQYSAAGCRKLATEWVGLKAELSTDGQWAHSRREHATRLMGRRPEDPSDETAFWIRFYNIAAQEPRNEAAMDELCGPEAVLPDTLDWIRGGTPPTQQAAREWLREMVTTELAAVRDLEKRLRINFEKPDRAAAVKQAMLLAPADMALWLRYERMHDSMFHRAYNTLERPEAARPDAEPEPAPDAETHDETTVAAASPESSPAGEVLVVTADADVECRTKRIVTDEPVAPAVGPEPVAVEPFTEVPAAESIATDPPAPDVPVGAAEAAVERRTKRVVTAEPVAPELGAAAAPKPAPAASRELKDPAAECLKEMADFTHAMAELGVTWPSPDEGEEGEEGDDRNDGDEDDEDDEAYLSRASPDTEM